MSDTKSGNGLTLELVAQTVANTDSRVTRVANELEVMRDLVTKATDTTLRLTDLAREIRGLEKHILALEASVASRLGGVEATLLLLKSAIVDEPKITAKKRKAN